MINDNAPKCPVCGISLTVRLAHGRKSNKAFIMLLCAADGRHFRGFISHRPYVEKVLESLEALHKDNQGGAA